MLYYIRFFRMCQNLCSLCIQAYLCSKKFRNGNFSRFLLYKFRNGNFLCYLVVKMPKWEFFLTIFIKSIKMVTRMEYLQLSENRPDFRPFFFRKLRWYPGRQYDGLVIRLILIYYILAKRLLPYIFCKITAFLHSKSLTLNFSKETSR